MPPGQRFRAYWESALVIFSKKEAYPHPLAYTVHVSYEDQHGRPFGPETYVLDFRVFEGHATAAKGMAELVRAIEDMTREQKKWTDGARGLSVKAWDADRESQRDHRPWRFRQARRAYEKGGWKAWVKYWIGHWRQRYGLWSR
jgi:hypothetical protein